MRLRRRQYSFMETFFLQSLFPGAWNFFLSLPNHKISHLETIFKIEGFIKPRDHHIIWVSGCLCRINLCGFPFVCFLLFTCGFLKTIVIPNTSIWWSLFRKFTLMIEVNDWEALFYIENSDWLEIMIFTSSLKSHLLWTTRYHDLHSFFNLSFIFKEVYIVYSLLLWRDTSRFVDLFSIIW